MRRLLTLSPAARLAERSRERAQVQARREHYQAIMYELQAKLREPGDPAASPLALGRNCSPGFRTR
jgi:hypothetical protein